MVLLVNRMKHEMNDSGFPKPMIALLSSLPSQQALRNKLNSKPWQLSGEKGMITCNLLILETLKIICAKWFYFCFYKYLKCYETTVAMLFPDLAPHQGPNMQ